MEKDSQGYQIVFATSHILGLEFHQCGRGTDKGFEAAKRDGEGFGIAGIGERYTGYFQLERVGCCGRIVGPGAQRFERQSIL